MNLASTRMPLLAIAVPCAIAVSVFGFGHVCVRSMTPHVAWLPFMSARLVFGVMVWTALSLLGSLAIPVPIILLAALAGGVWGLVTLLNSASRRDPALRSELATPENGLDALTIALVALIMTAETDWLVVRDGVVHLTRYPDFTWHLGMLHQMLASGLRLESHPAIWGAPRYAYHPAFNTAAALAVTPLKYLASTEWSSLLANDVFYRVLLPGTVIVWFAAVGVASSCLARSRIASPVSVGVALSALAVASSPVFADIAVHLGRPPIFHFMNNPPSALAVVFSATCLAFVLAAADRDGPGTDRRPLQEHTGASGLPSAAVNYQLVCATAVAAMVLGVKANVAIALLPALAITVLVGIKHKWWRLRDAVLGASVGAGVLGLMLLVISGVRTPLGIRWGVYSQFVQRAHDLATPTAWLAQSLSDRGPAADAVFLIFYALIDMVGISALGLLAWLLPRRRSGLARPSRAGATLLLVLTLMVLIIGLCVIQPGAGRYSAWGIAAHTMRSLFWLGIVFSVAGVLRLVPDASVRHPFFIAVCLSFVLTVGLLTPPDPLHSTSRTTRAPLGFWELLQRLDRTAGAHSVVVQTYDMEYVQWVSGLGGARAYLERAEGWRASMPDVARDRLRTVRALFDTDDVDTVRRTARSAGIDYVLLNTEQARESSGLLGAGYVVDRARGWLLVEIAH